MSLQKQIRQALIESIYQYIDSEGIMKNVWGSRCTMHISKYRNVMLKNGASHQAIANEIHFLTSPIRMK